LVHKTRRGGAGIAAVTGKGELARIIPKDRPLSKKNV